MSEKRSIILLLIILGILIFTYLKLKPLQDSGLEEKEGGENSGLKKTLKEFVNTLGEFQTRLQDVENRILRVENSLKKVDGQQSAGGGNHEQQQQPEGNHYKGEIKLGLEGKMCLDSSEQGAGEQLVLYECHGQGRNQFFELEDKKLHHKGLCLAAQSVELQANIIMTQCEENNGKQEWFYEDKHFKLDHNRLCMTANEETVMLMQCRDNDKSQIWLYVP